jgi:hypothetical protein
MESEINQIKLKIHNAIYKLRNEILNAMSNKLAVREILCDLKKAFDCVDYDIPLSKLKLYGISGKDISLVHVKKSTYTPEECRWEVVVPSRTASNIALRSITVAYRFKQKAQGRASNYT